MDSRVIAQDKTENKKEEDQNHTKELNFLFFFSITIYSYFFRRYRFLEFGKKRYIFVVVISDGISNLVQGISVKCRRREINSAKLWNVSASRLKWVCCFFVIIV